MERSRWHRRHHMWTSVVLGVLLLVLAVRLKLLVEDLELPEQGARNISMNVGVLMTAANSVIELMKGGLQFLSQWRTSRKPPSAPAQSDVDNAKDVLAGLVAEQWRDETILRSLADPEPIPVPWRSTEHAELMDHPRLIAKDFVSFPSLSADLAGMAAELRALRSRRLVILGGPGSGKTTLAVQLLMELLRTRLPGEPVPVLLSAARWDAEVHPRLQDWLADCIAVDYPALTADEFGPDVAKTLTARGGVLPVIDGLDELPGQARAGILLALNHSMSDRDQLILTCRTEQFAESVDLIGDVLTAAAVIEPGEITAETAADYLQACLPPRPHPAWLHVLDALRKGIAPALAEVTATPLGLWLVRSAYVVSRQDPAPLLELGRADAARLYDHLCDRFIPALVGSRTPAADADEPFRPRHSWDPEHVRHWLAYLSGQLLTPGEDTRNVAWWHLARYASTGTVRLMVSVVSGVLVGLSIAAVAHAPRAGALFGLVSALAVLVMTRSWFTEPPGHAEFQVRGRLSLLGRTLAEAVVAGLLGALVGGLMSHRAGGALKIALLSGLTYVLTVGLIRWVEHPTSSTTARSPRSTWRADRNLTLIRALCGLGVGLTVAAVGLVAKLNPPAVLAGGLLLGPLFGLILGSHHAWLAYTLTIPRLARRGRLPLRAMCFLDDAHRLGLLRTEGPFYQFRNVELQRRLARDHIFERKDSP
ncbi:NACHT domain-containing protein [Microbispora triticiradicis]|uniref:NACHT domain-containing protein n=2 Tax=Microbispora TaxID=2005 RepID=A0ABY3M1S1_9ACTN|nr:MULTISPECIES: NACHT domain-containing protein [Microbispora]TLP57087.1 NACHT domain-containing protein [Microbispora fusca]TYB64109.1 NACHT domain-containing protein [Microbispora tritici]